MSLSSISEPVRDDAAVRTLEQAFRILHVGYALAPTIAGIDKFTQKLTDWDQYLAPAIARRSPFRRRGLMRMVGAIEIAAGALVALKPRWGGYVVAGWLAGIITDLAVGRRGYDIALRDLGLAFGAVALARLAKGHELRRSMTTAIEAVYSGT